MPVLVVDYRSPDAPERFTRSLRETGFAAIVNHPLPPGLVDGIYAEWETFFLSGAARHYPHTDQQDGYFPPEVAETAKGATKRDLKEFFHVYQPWGQYPAEVSGAARDFHQLASELAVELLAWVEAETPKDVAASNASNVRFRRIELSPPYLTVDKNKVDGYIAGVLIIVHLRLKSAMCLMKRWAQCPAYQS